LPVARQVVNGTQKEKKKEGKLNIKKKKRKN
jgi:hypothetical protein